MPDLDPRIDTYIDKRPDFARDVLRHLREVVHEACPDVVETLKWGAPFFEHHGILCGMAAFKEHCALTFWKEKLLFSEDEVSSGAMGQYGKIRSVGDLPPREELIATIHRAMELNEQGVPVPREAPREDDLEVPEDLAAALAGDDGARAFFDGLAPGYRREYVEWITGAKREATRAKRLATAVEWLGEGKTRHWKYR
jgi:uncharacterized protein YdeI (YjbR/CyaY-like superfamily)